MDFMVGISHRITLSSSGIQQSHSYKWKRMLGRVRPVDKSTEGWHTRREEIE
jgi:hypothetical protein